MHKDGMRMIKTSIGIEVTARSWIRGVFIQNGPQFHTNKMRLAHIPI